MSVAQFCDWLSNTPLSLAIQDIGWIIPGTQTIHILAVATVFYLMCVFDLQVIGVLSRPKVGVWTRRPMPWLWGGLTVLALTGLVLIVGEPRRELLNWTFRLKVILIVLAAFLTAVIAHLAANERPSALARSLAALALTCWAAIIVCGRWIAYVGSMEDDA